MRPALPAGEVGAGWSDDDRLGDCWRELVEALHDLGDRAGASISMVAVACSSGPMSARC